MINNKDRGLVRLAVLLCTVTLVLLIEQSDCDVVQSLEGVVGDKEFSKVIKNYLDSVPSSHKARSHANRIISDHEPWREQIEKTMTTTTTTTTVITKKVTNTTSISYSQKSYSNKLSIILQIIFSIRITKDDGCSKCEPCLEPKPCPDSCVDCRVIKCPPCRIPDFCKYSLTKKKTTDPAKSIGICPEKPICKPCSKDSKSLAGTTTKPSELKTTTKRASKQPTKYPAPKTSTKPANGKQTESSVKPKTTLKPRRQVVKTTKIPSGASGKTSAKPESVDSQTEGTPPQYIMEEVEELVKTQKTEDVVVQQTFTTHEPTVSGLGYTDIGPGHHLTTHEPLVSGLGYTDIVRGHHLPFGGMDLGRHLHYSGVNTKWGKGRKRRDATTTTKSPTTKSPTTESPTTISPTTRSPTTTEPAAKSTTKPKPVDDFSSKPVVNVTIRKETSSYEKNKTISSSNGLNDYKVAENVKMSSSQFHGVYLFHKHLSALNTSEATRKSILKLIENIPTTLGGEDSLLAEGILRKFGEEPLRLIKKKGTTREFTSESARTKLMAVLGHILDRKVRKECGCSECEVCGCKLSQCPKKIFRCPPCPWTQDCIYPPHCEVYPPCDPCPDDDADDDGPEEDLDDVDKVDPILKDEDVKEIECTTGATCPNKSKFTCGGAPLNPFTPKTKSSEYMVGGEDIKYGEYPQFARLEIRVPGKVSNGLCGGTLISHSHVLTAGHCVQVKEKNSKRNYTKFKPEHFKVFLGDFKRKVKDSHEEQRNVTHITFSSKFNIPDEEGSRYDYAILTLNKPVKFTDYIQPACLPYEPFKIKPTTICYVVGIGITKFDKKGGQHEFAKGVQKMRVRKTSCKSWGFKSNDRSRHCFTKALDKGDTCGGDSGGPILCLDRKNRWNLMGIVSYGAEACDGSETTGWVAVYTRIRGLLSIIKKDSKNQNPKNLL